MAKMDKIKFLSDIEIAGTMTIGESKAEILTKNDLATPDWNQNDENAPDYVKNRTHYVYSDIALEEYVNGTTWYYDGYRGYPFNSNINLHKKAQEMYENSDYSLLQIKINNVLKTIIGIEFAIYNDGFRLNFNDGTFLYIEQGYGCYEAEYTEELLPITINAIVSIEKIQQLDEKYIPISIARTNGIVRSAAYDSQGNHIADTYAKKSEITDLFTPIDIMAELGAKDVSWNWYDDNWPKTDEDIVNMLTTVTANNQWPDDLFIKLFSLFETYPGILPAFGFFPKASGHGCKYKLTCSTERVEIDSYQETGSTIHPDFNFTYFINLSKDNYLELRFNYNSPDETAIDWDNINLDNLYLTFDLIPKGGNITAEQVAKLAQEQIITPALTEEVY